MPKNRPGAGNGWRNRPCEREFEGDQPDEVAFRSNGTSPHPFAGLCQFARKELY